MSTTKSLNFSDTAISGVSSLNFPRGLVNYKADWRVKSSTGNEVILTNITSPIDASETMRLACTDIKNIYTGTAIEPSLMSPSKSGISVLCELKETISVSDPANTDLDLRLPVSYHVVIKLPRSGYITTSDVATGLGRLVSGFFDTGSTATTRLEAILRGSLVPTDL